MKKIITLLILTTFFKGNSQCPAPSNINLIDNINLLSTAELFWVENGTATTWEIAVVPDFIVGSPLPTNVWATAATNPFVLTNIPPINGCYAFFVRSVCSVTDVSPWIAVGSTICTLNEFNYLVTLSNNNFSTINSKIKVYPNPTSDFLFIDTIEKQIQKIEFFDLQGRLIKTINENKDKYEIDISNLQSATYLVKLSTETNSETIRFVKN
ncbi:T9SS type A sorting domain-containing protein [Flavobacterium sp.]|jgi:hypothetical protein|uniref:T9SS type A sorting domain-containing protein n=2 Tax=Flavobacterium sp. TaxID=239 RepID=UPI0022BE4A58|nr:T9SS type A sorting domain-containing protein [Flavobacterium sp.]MCZ8145226.1 T9SS type A sorting domain-containing protein [Flavobacterium sp.]MCZ8368010.1 T9SS type A sorting domain-containing protein [Flavobacterium sp.]